MTAGVGEVVLTALWSIGAALVAWAVTTPLRRRSTAGLLAAVVLITTAAAVGAMVGGVEQMLLPMREEGTVAAIAAGAGVLGAVAAAAAGRRLARDNAALRSAITEVGQGRIPAGDGPPLIAELEHVRRELSRTARGLAASREREQALEASRRELVSWVSHDLRAPLAGLRVMAEALEDGVAEEPTHYYKRMAAEVDRLSEMVDDLFDLSRLTAGSFARDPTPVGVADLVSDVVAALRPLADAGDVHLVGRVTAPAATVLGTAGELNRAVTNLIANAVRHTPSGGTITVTVADEPTASGSVAVRVEDECGGIAAADLDRVFDVGFRGERARPRTGPNPGGAGLGLAIARGIARAHGGEVDVANTATGCRFRLTLPTASDPGYGDPL